MTAPGDLVYVACTDSKDEAFLPGTISSINEKTAVVKLDRGNESTEVPVVELRKRFARDDGATSQDNTALVHLNDATILENLQARHSRDEIYTYTASVLLAVNPYKRIHALYGDEQCALYRGKHIGALPPHPYAIADTAYRALMREQRNQGLLISGESGAGKTETAKIVMNYLAYASGATSDVASRIQARVLQAQPILESLGNAATMRNSNSSRFGKYNRVFFDNSGTLVDAGITTYLLESSRVVVHGDRERSYHCFYEMLAGLSDDKLQAFRLERQVGEYRLIATRQVSGFEEKDAANFRRTAEALKTVGVEDEAIDAMNQVLAGLLHLGNIPKQDETPTNAAADDESKTVDVDDESVETAAQVLGMDADELRTALIHKKVSVPGRDSFHKVPRTESQFRQALHSLIKALYNRLFERTVRTINDSFSELSMDSRDGAKELNHIGILDIYGFERLQRNSFEQLCINLANERLQQYFIENVLGAEQVLYTREGLPWKDLVLPDSTPVVNCISQVFATLDEFSQQLAKGFDSATDERFCQKTVQEAVKDQQRRDVLKQLKMTNKRHSTASMTLNDGFIIKHYAGPVEYSTKGWLDKNNDRLLGECEALICDSTVSFVKSLAEQDQGKTNFRSISKKYSQDLEGLLTTLGTCNLHYIRCFKPNEEQQPRIFKQPLVLDQIVQCGTIELVKIMHDGYPNRCPFDEVADRFKSLLPENFQRYGTRTFIEALMLAYEVPKNEWALGMSRLFLKAGQLKALEDMRSDGVQPDPEKLKAIVSGIIRNRWKRAGHAVRLCNYVPKFIAQIKVGRAKEALRRAALLTAVLAPRLAAARRRIEERRLAVRRRWRGAIRAVAYMCQEWQRIRSVRRKRLEDGLFLAAFIHKRIRPWVAGARARAHDAAQRREAERRREEERRRQEEARRAEEERRLAAEREAEEERQREERERLEAERLRLEEERRREEARLEELRRQEEARREEERQAEEALRAAREAELEQERRRLDEERERARVEEEARQREERETIRQERARLEQERLEQEQARKALEQDRLEQEQARKALEQERQSQEDEKKSRLSISQAASPMRRTSLAESPRAWPTSPDERESLRIDVRKEIDKEMEERIRTMEREFDRKQREVLAEMSTLRQRNTQLERRIEEEKECEHEDRYDDDYGSPVVDRAQASPLGSSPVGSPGGSDYSAAHMSPLSSLDGSPTDTMRKKRNSVAAEALMMGAPEIGVSVARSEGATGSQRRQSLSMTAGLQRAWWKEQRDLLMQDLNPTSLSLPDPPRFGRAHRKTTTASPGDLAMTATRSEAARPSPPVVTEEEEDTPMGRANTCCNLSRQLEGIPGGSSTPRAQGETKMKKPAVYTWSNRTGKH